METKIKINERARTYGYIIWGYRMDAEMGQLLGRTSQIRVVFHGKDLGTKQIDWNRRRISVGQKQTKKVPTAQQYFVLTNRKKGELIVKSE